MKLPKSDAAVVVNALLCLRRANCLSSNPKTRSGKGSSTLKTVLMLVAEPLQHVLFHSTTSSSSSSGSEWEKGRATSSLSFEPFEASNVGDEKLCTALKLLPQHSLTSLNDWIVPGYDIMKTSLCSGLDRLYSCGDEDKVRQVVARALYSPLISQDLHTTAVAAGSTARDLSAFLLLNALLCVARLTQICIEPAVTDFYCERERRSTTKKAASSSSLQPQTVAKKSRKDDPVCVSGGGFHPHPHHLHPHPLGGGGGGGGNMGMAPPTAGSAELEGLGEVLLCFRGIVCGAAGVPLAQSMLTTVELAAIVLDSWIPFLEFAFHLHEVMRIVFSGPSSTLECENLSYCTSLGYGCNTVFLRREGGRCPALSCWERCSSQVRACRLAVQSSRRANPCGSAGRGAADGPRAVVGARLPRAIW